MKLQDIAPIQIARDHFSRFRFGQGREFSWGFLASFAILPAILSVFSWWFHPSISEKHQAGFLAVYSILAAALTQLLPVAQAVVGLSSAEVSKTYNDADFHLWKGQLSRLQVLRELYADICFTILLLVVSLVPILGIGVVAVPSWCRAVMVYIIYFVGFSVAMSFLHICCGIYLALCHQADEVQTRLIKNGPGGPRLTQESEDHAIEV